MKREGLTSITKRGRLRSGRRSESGRKRESTSGGFDCFSRFDVDTTAQVVRRFGNWPEWELSARIRVIRELLKFCTNQFGSALDEEIATPRLTFHVSICKSADISGSAGGRRGSGEEQKLTITFLNFPQTLTIRTAISPLGNTASRRARES